MTTNKNKMWDGRFATGMSSSMEKLSICLHYDRKLLSEDVQGSIAHTLGLVQSEVLTAEEQETIATGLLNIQKDIESGADLYEATDEDIHMALERILTERIGDLGKKMHTGRSRNDQIATDFKLYMTNRALGVIELIKRLQSTILEVSQTHQEQIMPGYTHVQQAQPILFAHYLMSFFFVLQRDINRLEAFVKNNNQMPLGSGAMAGSAFPYERQLVADQLGFPEVSPNSIDAISHRDIALEFANDLAIIGSTLSRYAEDFVTWSTVEFGFLSLHDAFSSGSSMMPQKKNPDSMEIVRGKAGRLLGNYTALFTVIKGAPLTYSRDLQEDKEPIFDSVETVEVILQVMQEAIMTATWNFATMRSKMLPALLATDLADYLVEEGIAFRDAHHIVGSLVGQATRENKEFLDLDYAAWSEVPNQEEIRAKLTFENAVKRRDLEGGTGPNSLAAQLKLALELLQGKD
tara:strand:- start:2863 stop:4248 length:1386 start_codon:yes stop_codon:yes gene_type:complete